MSDDESVTLLKEIATVTPREGTDFVDITVKTFPKEKAIRLANAIAEVGVERGAAIQKTRAKRALEALDEELSDQETRMLEFKKTLDSLPSDYPLPRGLGIAGAVSKLPRGYKNYLETKQAYEQSRLMLREMKLKQREARVLLKTPHTPITIHRPAK